MKRLCLVLLFVSVWLAGGEAHQLDEYLQASKLEIFHDRVVVHLALTPGVSIAQQIFELIDRDRDGSVSASEVEAYARQVMPDVSLRIDGQRFPLTLTRAESPAWNDLRDGTGTIRLEAVAQASLLKSGSHQVVYQNMHQPSTGVYLVNVLKPSSHDVAVLGQRRDVLQHSLDVDLRIDNAVDDALVIGLGLLVFSGLLMLRLRSTLSQRRSSGSLTASSSSGAVDVAP